MKVLGREDGKHEMLQAQSLRIFPFPLNANLMKKKFKGSMDDDCLV